MISHAKATSAIAALCCGIVLCLSASPAFAAKGVVGFFGSEGVEGGQFANPGGAAVNQNGTGGASAGDLYVVDRGNKRIQQFHADGTWVRAFGLNVNPLNEGTGGLNVCEVAASCAAGTSSGAAAGMNLPQGIAIEQSTGNLYVSDQGNRRIDVFSAAGAFEGAFGWKVQVIGAAEEVQLCSAATECQAAKAGADAGQFQSLGQTVGFPALSPQNGHLFLADKGNRRIDEFETTLTAGKVTAASFVRGFGWKVNKEAPAEEFQTCTTASHCQIGLPGSGAGQFGSSSPTALAIDTTGRLYALDAANQRVQAFSSTPTPEGAFAEAILSGEPALAGLTVDPSNNHLLAIKPFNGEERILELDSAGNLLETYGKEVGIPAASGIASVPGGGDIYLTTSSGLAGQPGVFLISSSAPAPPSASIEAVSNFTPFTATFEGHVNPGNWETAYRFEYSTDGSSWTRLPENASEDELLPGDNAEHAVSAEAQGLEGSTEYQVKLVATKRFNAGSAEAQTSFQTAASAPIVSATTHSHLHDTSAQLQGQVNPENQQTEYSFQYVDQAHFEAEGFANAKSAPVPPGELSGGQALEVKAQISGLSQATTYRYRLSATNPTGTVHGPEGEFTTYSSPQVFEPCSANEALRTGFGASLPDCRAYEQASPVDKNGGALQAYSRSTKASVSGDAITFESAAGVPGGEGSQEFPGYVARRGEGGWSTQGMLPPASAGEGAVVLGWTPDFAQVFDSASKFGLGTTLLSRSSAGPPVNVTPYADADYSFDATSADGSVVLFRASGEFSLVPGSPTPVANRNLYAWDRDTGQLRLASVLPDGSAPPGESEAPNGASGYSRDMHAVTSDGSAFFTETQSGQLYLRENPTEPETTQKDGEGNCIPDPVLACTVHVSASQKTVADPDGPQPATFQGASADGSAAFFTSSEELTDDAHTIAPPNVISSSDLEGENVRPSHVPGANAAAIAVDANHIYWADPADDSIGRADLDGENPDPSFITGADNPQGVAVIDEPGREYVYWTNAADGEAGTGSVGRADLNGANVNQGCVTGATNPGGVDLDADHIYWADNGNVARADLGCTNPNYTFYAETGGALDVAVDTTDTHIYIALGVGAPIVEIPIDGSSFVVLDTTGAEEIAVDDSHLYWTGFKFGSGGETVSLGIVRSDLDGTNEEPNFISAQNPQGLAVDANHVFWGAHPSGRGNDLYRYEAASDDLADLTPDTTDLRGAEVMGVLGASEDASYVYFAANGVLAANPGARGTHAVPGSCSEVTGVGGGLSKFTGSCNLYLWHDGAFIFIARLDADGSTFSDGANWVTDNTPFETTPFTFQKTARVSADGHTLLFRSRERLSPYDNEGQLELYRYRAGDAGPTCVSCNPTGAPPFGPATLGNISPPVLGASGPAAVLSRNFSADGNRVFFETTDALVAVDTDGDEGCPPWGSRKQEESGLRACQDVYEWEENGSGSCHSEAQDGGCLYLISTGKSPDASFLADASASGSDVFFFTSSRLVGQDQDGLIDVYDAREGGGLKSQNEVPPVPCEGEGCKRGAEEAPAFRSPATPAFSGPPSPSPRRPGCHKGSARKHGRCVKRHHKKKSDHRRHSRDAKTTGRAGR